MFEFDKRSRNTPIQPEKSVSEPDLSKFQFRSKDTGIHHEIDHHKEDIDLNGLQGGAFRSLNKICSNRMLDARIAEDGQIQGYLMKWNNNGFSFDQLMITLQRFEGKVSATTGQNMRARIEVYLRPFMATFLSRRFGVGGASTETDSANLQQAQQRSVKKGMDAIKRRTNMAYKALSKDPKTAFVLLRRSLMGLGAQNIEILRRSYYLKYGRDFDKDIASVLNGRQLRTIKRMMKTKRGLNRSLNASARSSHAEARRARRLIEKGAVPNHRMVQQLLSDPEVIRAYRDRYGSSLAGDIWGLLKAQPNWDCAE